MNDKIKTILEFLDDNLWVKYGNTYQKSLNDKECKLLLDYITNLQKEIGHLDKVNCQLRKKINNDIYKSRIEKAVEYITNTEDMCYYGKCNDGDLLIKVEEDFKNDLLNILNGRSDE